MVNRVRRRPFGLTFLLLFVLISASLCVRSSAQPSAVGGGRVPWTTSKIVGSPEPPPPLKQVIRYPNLKFTQPLYIERDPANQRIWVMTRTGKVWSFPDDRNVNKPDLFLDFKESFAELTPHESAVQAGSTLGLAFHPNYPKVPVCWLVYTITRKQRKPHLEDGTRLSRFNILFDQEGIPRCDPTSEKILMTWLEGGHNGSTVKFGPDGYLYVSAGDGEVPNPPDPRRNGQDVTNIMSSILRIDVNPTDEGPLYRIPEDNPFAANSGKAAKSSTDSDLNYSLSEVKPEIWAYGFRNPWRMNFGPDGQLWVGDVGWELYEMVYNVKPGSNYGWPIMEGPQPVIPDAKRGPTPISAPALSYSHAEGASVTGGFVYQGQTLPELRGKYVFGDYETRRIWSADITADSNLNSNGEADRLTNLTDLVDPTIRIVAFGEDTSGELLLLHFDEGTIYELKRNDAIDQPTEFPQRISETGLFVNAVQQIPAAGVIPFNVTEPMWNDAAVAKRFVGLPSVAPINVLRKPTRMKQSSLRENMQFPINSVLARTVSLQDDTATNIKLETQILHFNGKIWAPYTYVWNPEQTDADLAPAQGSEISLEQYGTFAERKTWKVHSRSECIRCHNSWVGGSLAFTLPQLNCSAPESQSNQLQQFIDSGILTGAVPPNVAKAKEARVAGLVTSADSAANLNARARSYLSVNCAHCHQKGAGGTATINLQHHLANPGMQAVGASAVQGTFQIPNSAIVKPGDPSRSVLLYRVACSGRGRMPHIGSELVDANGVKLLREWIASLPSDQPIPDTAASLATTPEAMQLLATLDADEIANHQRDAVLEKARSAPAEIRNLFTRFQPVEFRQQQNRNLNVAKLLNTAGNAERGGRIFANKNLQCANCHQMAGKGGQIGPALDDVGARLKPEEILESVVNPSGKIDPKFAAWTALTVEGKVHSGLLVKRTGDRIVLRTTKNEDVEIAADNLEELIQQTTSLMPDRLLNDLSDQQIADLLAFLSNAKDKSNNTSQ